MTGDKVFGSRRAKFCGPWVWIMSWVASAARTPSTEVVRRSYFLTVTTSDATVYVRDQLPVNVPLLVSGVCDFGSTATNSGLNSAAKRVSEVRLHNACSTERTYSDFSRDFGQYIVLGWLQVKTGVTGEKSQFAFTQAPAVEARTMKNGPWRFVVWDVVGDIPAAGLAVARLTYQIDVRSPEVLHYHN